MNNLLPDLTLHRHAFNSFRCVRSLWSHCGLVVFTERAALRVVPGSIHSIAFTDSTTQEKVHEGCMDKLTSRVCTLGRHRKLIVPPSGVFAVRTDNASVDAKESKAMGLIERSLQAARKAASRAANASKGVARQLRLFTS